MYTPSFEHFYNQLGFWKYSTRITNNRAAEGDVACNRLLMLLRWTWISRILQKPLRPRVDQQKRFSKNRECNLISDCTHTWIFTFMETHLFLTSPKRNNVFSMFALSLCSISKEQPLVQPPRCHMPCHGAPGPPDPHQTQVKLDSGSPVWNC